MLTAPPSLPLLVKILEVGVDEEWISRAQWEKLLRVSRDLLRRIDYRTRLGQPVAHLWGRLGPINERIRSANLKVIGIDDKAR